MAEKGIFDGLPDISAWLMNYKGAVTGLTLSEKLIALVNGIAKGLAEHIWPTFNRAIVQEFKDQMAINCIDENLFDDPALKAEIIRFKREWSNSPVTPSDVAEGLLKFVTGRTAQLQLESMLGLRIGGNTPITDSVFGQMALVSDVANLTATLGMIGEVASIGQIDQLGREMRVSMDYSGVTQITGFGYGQILNSVVAPLIQQELSAQVPTTLMTVGEMQNGLNRGFIGIDAFNTDLRKMGFSADKIDTITKQACYQPTAPDLVRFAVREVYSPVIAEAYGQYQDYPPNFTAEAKKAGLVEEDARKYWAAHWELPSLTMGYDMFHRRIISETQLQTLMRAQDVMPFWRPLLAQLSYHPLTRVDVRRMYKAGSLTEEQVRDSYLDVGYSPANAALMVDWTKKAYAKTTTAGKDFVIGQIQQSYKGHDIDVSKAREFLALLHYSPAQTDLFVKRWDVEIRESDDDNAAAAMQIAYLSGTLSAEAYIQRVSGLTISEKKKAAYIKAAKTAKKASTPTPPIADLTKFWAKGIITEQIYRDRVTALGYTAETVGWYVALNRPEA